MCKMLFRCSTAKVFLIVSIGEGRTSSLVPFVLSPAEAALTNGASQKSGRHELTSVPYTSNFEVYGTKFEGYTRPV